MYQERSVLHKLNKLNNIKGDQMSKLTEVKDKAKEALKEVDTEVLQDNIGIVLDTVETINKTNTSSTADNIQRGVQDARKVLGVLSLLKAALSVFKRK